MKYKSVDKKANLNYQFLVELNAHAWRLSKILPESSPSPLFTQVCLELNYQLHHAVRLPRSLDINCPNGNCQKAYFLTPIWNYGCWCNLDNHKGSGKPVNKIDNLCKSLQLCKKCTEIQYVDTCDVYHFNEEISGVSKCFLPENSECQKEACVCEVNFVTDLVDILLETGFESQYRHENWDGSMQCKAISRRDVIETPDPQPRSVIMREIAQRPAIIDLPNAPENNNESIIKCCGIFGRRSPYNTKVKKCCDDVKLFNPSTHECCGTSTGKVGALGTC